MSGLEEQELARQLEVAARLTLAVLSSASPEVIGPKNWWTRARSALEVALESAEAWEAVAAVMARQLQVENIRPEAYKEICSLGGEVRRWGFEPWRQACLECALMVVAQARYLRDQRKEQAGEAALPWEE